MKIFQLAFVGLGLLQIGAAQTCSDGTAGVESASGTICCTADCTVCGGPDCPSAGTSCCGGPISEAGLYCDTNDAPCIIGSAPPATTCSDGTAGVESSNGVVCCPIGCTQCAGAGCSSAGTAANLPAGSCCGGAITGSGVYCEDGANPAPCIIGFSDVDTCSDGTPGIESASGTTCCTLGCTQCGGPGCPSFGLAAGLDSSDCCGGEIAETGLYCGDGNPAPCLIGTAPTPAPTPAPTMPVMHTAMPTAAAPVA